VLRLAVIKSVRDGEQLLYGNFRQRAQEAKDFIDSLGESASENATAASGQQRAKQMAGQKNCDAKLRRQATQ
jgi:hypothetical protein